MIVSTTLAGPGAERNIGDALRSVVGQVDHCLVAFSGCDEELTREAISAAVPEAKLITRTLPWPGRYDFARQQMLEWAGSLGAKWAVTVDCDERVTLPHDYRNILDAHPAAHVWNLRGCDHGPCDNQSPGHGYCKERILRADLGLRWHGRVCENVQSNRQGVMVGHFWENAKTPEEERRRYERGVTETERMIAEGDDRFKWWRHLGTCHAGLGRMGKALECYEEALKRPHGPEDEARCSYLICEQLVIAGRLDEAHDRAAMGLARHAGFIPEFGSILAWVQMKAGDLENASRWAQLVQICPPDRKRIGHRGKECHQRAQAVLKCLDDHNEAAQAGKVDPHADRHTIGGVVVALSDRFSAPLRRAVQQGAYEASERELLDGLLAPGDRLLELGGGCGYLAAAAAKRIGSDAVLTVEADPEMLPTLEKTFALNAVSPKVRIGTVAATDAPHALVRGEHFWGTRSEPGPGERALPLEALIAEHRPSVMLCDIEGGEAGLCGLPLPGVRAVIIEAHSGELRRRVQEWLTTEGFDLSRQLGNALAWERRVA